MCTFLICEKIDALDKNVILTTRECLSFGKRNAVDQTLFRLVKAGVLIRIARGVFVKAGSDIPSNETIMAAKARAFGRVPFEHAGNRAVHLGFSSEEEKVKYDINGSSSSFWTKRQRIGFSTTAGRKLLLDQSDLGQTIRSVWFLKESNVETVDFNPINAQYRSLDSRNRSHLSLLMPAWINDRLVS